MLVYIFSVFIGITKGNISMVIGIITGLYLILNFYMLFLSLYVLLLASASLKEWFIKNKFIKQDNPVL